MQFVFDRPLISNEPIPSIPEMNTLLLPTVTTNKGPLFRFFGYRISAVFLLVLSMIFLDGRSPLKAGQSVRILTSRDAALVGQTHQFHIDLRYPGAATRVTALVQKPGDRHWTTLAQNAPRAGSTPYISWRPDRVGSHTVRVDVVTPGEREIRKTKRIEVVEDRVSLSITGGRAALGSSVILVANYSGGEQNRSLAFSVKYDDDNRWQSIRGGSTKNSIRWFPARSGRAEVRVQATDSRGHRIEGFSRVFVNDAPRPVRMTGRPPGAGGFPPFRNLITIDQSEGIAGAPRTLTLHLHGEARANRRILIRFRHVTRNRSWVVHRENSDRLIVPWTPWHAGEYRIEASIESANGEGDFREEIHFRAIDPRR